MLSVTYKFKEIETKDIVFLSHFTGSSIDEIENWSIEKIYFYLKPAYEIYKEMNNFEI